MFPAQLLIIEDNKDIAHLLKLYFKEKGYQVALAGSGEEALQKASQLIPHLIILDIILPDIDGYAICRRLRSVPRTSHMPIIFLTQKDEKSDKLQGLQLGADDYITKPFDLEELGWRVQNAISRSEREQFTDALTGLPARRVIEIQLDFLNERENWAVMDLRLEGLEEFQQREGATAANQIIKQTGQALISVLEKQGHPTDFVGQASRGNFILITSSKQTGKLTEYIRQALTDLLNQNKPLKLSIGTARQTAAPYQSTAGIIQKANENRQVVTQP